jgi:transposase
MSAAYWSAVREHLPQAVLVFDKFHAINLFNVKIDEVRRQVQKQAERAGHRPIRGVRYLLLTGSELLDEDKKARLQEALAPNEPLTMA